MVPDEYTNTFVPVTPLPENETRFPASLDEAETLAGFEILEPAFLPEGYVLTAIDYSAADQHIGLLYYNRLQDELRQVYLLQQKAPFSEHQSLIGASAVVQKLTVNGSPAEYIQGNFDDAGSTDTVDRLIWNPPIDLGRIRWESGDTYLQISAASNLDADTLQRIAESLTRHEPNPNATPLPTLTYE